MSQPIKIQLALQGGGAKLVSLLAAVETIQDLSNQGHIQITRVAGTSAGAIAACLLASGQPISGIRNELQRISKAQWQKMLPSLSRSWLVWRLIRNEPFWESQPLRDFLATFFDERQLRKLGDLKKASGIDVFIVAADVTNSRKRVYSDKDDPIVNSLLDSCALPFVLRTAKNSGGQVIVDGGICENLPSEELETGTLNFGQVIGISFQDTSPGKPPNSPWELGLSLLETSINNSVLRARRRLGDRAVFSIDSEIGTFDFNRALDAGLNDTYKYVKLQAREFFDEILAVSQGAKDLLVGDPWRHGDGEIMAKISEIYRLQHEPVKFEYLRSAIVVQANCLLGPNDPGHGTPDLIKHILTFKPLGGPVYCHKLSLSTTSGRFLGRASWSVRDERGTERNTVMLPILNPQKPSKRELLLFFDPIISENDPAAPFTIVLQDLIQDSMIPLKKDHEDSLRVTPRRSAGDGGRVDIILLVPQDFPTLEMTASRLEDGSPGPTGQEMSPQERSKIDVPPGFVPVGWTGIAPKGGGTFGVDFKFANH